MRSSTRCTVPSVGRKGCHNDVTTRFDCMAHLCDILLSLYRIGQKVEDRPVMPEVVPMLRQRYRGDVTH
ncbi:hypothetical protein QQ056_15665 [Oscillatoria laete-virens NRMC-F 0139]|nr:hypothetical protein [Oscillatoria laete-virens]MDL5054976.1 hypothetical protein [Oscillatoria laete-virens NRMC-F 0139]